MTSKNVFTPTSGIVPKETSIKTILTTVNPAADTALKHTVTDGNPAIIL